MDQDPYRRIGNPAYGQPQPQQPYTQQRPDPMPYGPGESGPQFAIPRRPRQREPWWKWRPRKPVEWLYVIGGAVAAVVFLAGGVAGALQAAGGKKASAAPAATHASATPVASPSSKASALPNPVESPWYGTGPCPPGPDLLVWVKSPGAPAAAQALGSYDSAACRRVHRLSTVEQLQRTSPTGPGQCTQAAYASDNPGYEKRWLDGPDADTVVPPRLKHVVMSVGAAC
jgi:hypothetical protein